LRDTVFSV